MIGQRLRDAALALLLLCAPASAIRAQTPPSASPRPDIHIVPLASWHSLTGAVGGLSLLQVKPGRDTLGTRPSTLMADVAVAHDFGWRTSVAYEAWRLGNRRRLSVVAYASEMPTAAQSGEHVLRPKREGFDLRHDWKTGAASWLYLGVGGRRSSGDEVPSSPIAFNPSPLCPDCPIALRSSPQQASSSGPVFGYSLDQFSMRIARAGFVRDSRDNIFAPSAGRLVDISLLAQHYKQDWWEDRNYTARLDYRRYRTVRDGSVLAVQGVLHVESADGSPLVSDEHVDGYLGRSVGTGRPDWNRTTMFAQAELRSPMHWARNRLGVAVFGSAAMNAWELSGTERTHFAVGAGLRYRLNAEARTTLRLDAVTGYSGLRAVYLALNEAF